MGDPLLIPAYPQVLAPGLLIRFGGAPHVVTFVEPTAHSAKGFNANAVNVDPADPELGTEIGPLYHHLTRLDLREPAVRDAVARAIWRTLRPNEPEPLTAPRFTRVLDEARWELSVADPHGEYGGDLPLTFLPSTDGPEFNGEPWEYNCVIVTALGRILADESDRDLLALAAIAAHVLEGSNG